MIYVLMFIVSLSLLIYVTFAVNAYLRLKVHLTFDHLFIYYLFFFQTRLIGPTMLFINYSLQGAGAWKEVCSIYSKFFVFRCCQFHLQ
jgi:hypothetical protein